MKFSIKDFFSKCDQIRRTADTVTFTEEILNGKLHFWAVLLVSDKHIHAVHILNNIGQLHPTLFSIIS